VPFEVYKAGVFLARHEGGSRSRRDAGAWPRVELRGGPGDELRLLHRDPRRRDLGSRTRCGWGPGRIYVVEPRGEFEDDPNVTNKKFPGNPTQCFRSREPLRVIGELVDWIGHAPERLQAMHDGLDALKRQGAAQIED